MSDEDREFYEDLLADQYEQRKDEECYCSSLDAQRDAGYQYNDFF